MMDIKFVTKPEFAVMGMEGSGPANQAAGWIKPLWAKASQHFGEIQEQVTGPAWGLMSAPDRFLQRWTERGRYLAGWEVSLGAKAVGPWAIWRVPATTYATVACTVKTYGEAMSYVENTLRNDGEYEAAGAIHEHYPNTCKDPATDSFYLYFTVKKTAR